MLRKLTQDPFLHPQWHNHGWLYKSLLDEHSQCKTSDASQVFVLSSLPIYFYCRNFQLTSSRVMWTCIVHCAANPLRLSWKFLFFFTGTWSCSFFRVKWLKFIQQMLGLVFQLSNFELQVIIPPRETGIIRLPSPWACSCSINLARWEPQLIRICRNHCHCC